MTVHELNNTIARAWIQHQRQKYNVFEQEEYKTKVLNIKNRIITELNAACYEQHKELIELAKGQPVVLKLKYSYKKFTCVNEYPLSFKNINDWALQDYMKADWEFESLSNTLSVKQEKQTTDRGKFYVQCMLLYKPEMKQTEFYETIKTYYTT